MAVEHGRPYSPAAFNYERRVDCVASLKCRCNSGSDGILGMRLAPLGDEVCPRQILVDVADGRVAEDRQSGGGDPEREPDALVEDMGAQREAALLAENAYGFVASAGRQERTFAGLARQAVHDVAGLVGDVVAVGRICAQEV